MCRGVPRLGYTTDRYLVNKDIFDVMYYGQQVETSCQYWHVVDKNKGWFRTLWQLEDLML